MFLPFSTVIFVSLKLHNLFSFWCSLEYVPTRVINTKYFLSYIKFILFFCHQNRISPSFLKEKILSKNFFKFNILTVIKKVKRICRFPSLECGVFGCLKKWRFELNLKLFLKSCNKIFLIQLKVKRNLKKRQ